MARETATSLLSIEDAVLQAASKLEGSADPDKGVRARLVELFVSTGTIAGTQWQATVEQADGE